MLATRLNYGIPDIDLPWSCGGMVNPSCFAGHQLLVLFLPTDEARQAAEFKSYEGLADELSGTDAWFLAVGTRPMMDGDGRRVPVAFDPDGAAWQAFTKLAGQAGLERVDGAAFLFTRGGAFHRLWPGSGHAREVVRELLSRQ
jgi:peroxiredoxin